MHGADHHTAQVDSVIAWLANYLLWVMAAGAVAYWVFRENRAGKITLAASAIIGLGLTLVFIAIAARLHTDPRPFVQNPRLHPLIAHSADNGFPSDHSAAAGLIATLIALRDRLLGVVFGLVAVIVAAARVAAHVHHLQDVAIGLVLGALAATIATVLAGFAISRRTPASRRGAIT